MTSAAYCSFIYIPRYTTATATRRGALLYFVVSPWNPYDSMLMRAEIAR